MRPTRDLLLAFSVFLPTVIAGVRVVSFAAAQTTPPHAELMPAADAATVARDLRADVVPPALRGLSPSELAKAWPAWAAEHDRQIRQRLARGDEDSVVNFLLLGTSFTTSPPATARHIARFGHGATAADVVGRRLNDLVAALASGHGNERVAFARSVVSRHGIDPSTSSGRIAARKYLSDLVLRFLGETEAYDREVDAQKQITDPATQFAKRSTLYRTRGLSSDTSILPDFAIEQALASLKSRGVLPAGSVRRVAVVGPGLDFTDKHDGYDFYPMQTVQPFAVIDSLRRLGIGAAGDLELTTFDVSPRINQHVDAARANARRGVGYVVQLPRDKDAHWTPALVDYWQRFGSEIGEAATAIPAPAEAGDVDVRATRIRPQVVLSIRPVDLNIVVQRMSPLDAAARFDLIVGTNVFLYYDVFEQALAMSNIAAMLRSGGVLISNNALFEPPDVPLTMGGTLPVRYDDRQDGGDTVAWYRRK